MRNGICPKCKRATVYSGRDIPVKASTGNRIPIDFKHSVAIDNYVCTSCGYIERYISDDASLKRINENWPPSGKNKHKR